MATLHDNQWQAIRTAWEYDPDEPSYNAAAQRAGQKFAFAPPGKSSIDARAKRESWTRRGNLNGVNAAAQRRADTQTSASACDAGKANTARGDLSKMTDAELDAVIKSKTRKY